MKNSWRIGLVSAAALLVVGLSACGENPAADTDTSFAQSTAEVVQEQTSATTQSAQTTQTTSAAAPQKEDADDKEEKAEPVTFVYGVWNNGKDTEYAFNTDGTGMRKNVTSNTSEVFRFEVNEKKARIEFRFGEKGKKETAKYAIRNDTHMTLTFSAKEVVNLEFGVLLTKNTLPFQMGKWNAADGTTYVFRADGSGAVQDTQTGASVAFQYEVQPQSRLIIFHMGSAEDETPAVYTMYGQSKMVIAFDGSAVELTRESEKE